MGNMLAILLTAIVLLAGALDTSALPESLIPCLRDVVVSLDFDPTDVRQAETTAKGSHELGKNGNGDMIRFHLTSDQAGKTYALRIQQGESAPPERIAINGQPLEMRPVRGEDGWYFPVSSLVLREGENVLELTPRVGFDRPKELLAVEMVSLELVFEQAHFQRVFGVAGALVQPPADADQLKFDVLHYDLDIDLDMTRPIIPRAALTMTAVSLDSTLTTVPLDFNGNGGALIVTQVDEGPGSQKLAYSQDPERTRLFIDLTEPVPEGQSFIVRVSYEGFPGASEHFYGLTPYNVTTHGRERAPIVYTFSEPYDARRWWPCKDLPDDKATSSMHITCPSSFTAVSNGLLESVTDRGDGTHTFNWRESYPIATYLVSIACSDYSQVTETYTALDGETTMPVSHYFFPECRDCSDGAAGTVTALEFFAETFGEYPFLTEKYSNVVWAFGNAMEHQTCTSIFPSGITGDGLNGINIHELAHQWFGDKITMRHFDHLWLNEGFATYCQALFLEHQEGVGSYHTEMARFEGFVPDSAVISPNADRFTSAVYHKGAWVLHMLRRVVGDDVFFEALRNYVADPAVAYGTALTPDLQAHFEALHGESLSWFFDEWLYQTRNPINRWHWRTWREGDSHILGVVVRQTVASGEDPYRMPYELTVIGTEGETETRRIPVEHLTQTFKIDMGALQPANIGWDIENWVLDTPRGSTSFPSGAIWVSASTVDFGDVDPGMTVTRELTLENLGTESLQVDALEITGLHTDAYEADPPTESITIEPGVENGVQLTVRFTPLEDGIFNDATLEITATGAGPAYVSLHGEGVTAPVNVAEWRAHRP